MLVVREDDEVSPGIAAGSYSLEAAEDTGRLLALSDGVFAFAMTLLVTNLSLSSILGFAITAIALVMFGLETPALLRHGGWERLAVAPALLWVVVVGIGFLRDPRTVETVPKPRTG